MKRLLKTVKNNFLSVFFIVDIAVGMVSVCKPQALNIIDGFLQSDRSLSYLIKAPVLKLLDIRYGGVNLEPDIKLKAFYIHLNGLIQRVIGNDYIYDAGPKNDVVRLNNGYLTTCLPKLTDKSLNEITGGITEFSEFLAEEGIDFLYVQLPFKICAYDKQLPVGVEDYSNENADCVLSVLEGNSVDTFDMRGQYKKAGLDYYPLFFRTDHHWLPSTALWSMQRLCEKLNDDYGFNTDPSLLDSDKFTQTTYKDLFLGSLGRRVGMYYAGVDDFVLLLPEYETDIVYSYHKTDDHYLDGEEFRREGSFYEAFIEKEHLEKNYMEGSPYLAYSGRDYSETITINKNISEGKILIIRDSFSCVATPLLSLAACRELHTLDMRNFYGSVSEYALKLKPDMVIVMLNPSMFRYYRFNFSEKV